MSPNDIYSGVFRNSLGRDVTIAVTRDGGYLALWISGAEVLAARDTAEGGREFSNDVTTLGRVLSGAAAKRIAFHAGEGKEEERS